MMPLPAFKHTNNMHNIDLDLNIDELTKVEGAASVDIKIRGGKVEYAHFAINEYKRFFTEAIKGKSVSALPQLLSRICGTCSNAHILCSIESCERALGIKPSEQTILLRLLTMYGLNIRDHALHLYLFALPDIFGKDAFLDFDENDPIQHQLLHDAFEIKAAGNFLSILIAGRSVHAMHPTIGGFLHFPDEAGIAEAVKKMEAIRPAVLRIIKVFEDVPLSDFGDYLIGLSRILGRRVDPREVQSEINGLRKEVREAVRVNLHYYIPEECIYKLAA